MGVYIPNIEMPRECNSCPLVMKIDNTCSLTMGGCTKDERPPHCPLIEINDEVWENEKYKLIRMTEERRVNKKLAERRADEDSGRVVETASVRP